MQHQDEWRKQWKAVEDQSKQRKRRENAPKHRRKQFLKARLSDRLQEKIGVKQATIRVGDTVEVMRGDWKGIRGEVTRINYDTYNVFVDGVVIEANDGSESKVPLDPSNLLLTDVSLSDNRRLKQADEDGRDELVQQEKEADETEEEAEAEDEDTADAGESTEPGPAPEDIVSGTVSEAKEQLKTFDGDVEDVLQAEKNGKNRKTLVTYIENQLNNED